MPEVGWVRARLAKLEKALKNPKVQIPTRDQLEVFVAKVLEEGVKCRRGRHDTAVLGRAQERVDKPQDDDDDLGVDEPPGNPAASEGRCTGNQGESVGGRGRNAGRSARKAPETTSDSEVGSQQSLNAESRSTAKTPGPLPLTEKRARAGTNTESSVPQHGDDEDNLPENDTDTVPPY